MTRIFSTEVPSTLQKLIKEFSTLEYKGWKVEAWVFNDIQPRRAAEEALLQYGVTARIHSAYKPLLHFFIEDLKDNLVDSANIQVLYPVHKQASDKRFILEAYPLTALIEGTKIEYEVNRHSDKHYEVITRLYSGEQYQYQVFTPNHIHRDLIGDMHLSPTGWIKVSNTQGKLIRDERIVTDYESLFSSTMQAITSHDWGCAEPYFDELNISVEIPWTDQKLAYAHESISLSEALHEDFYLSLQEWFNTNAGRSANDRGGQPGQIVPEILSRQRQTLSVIVETRPFSKRAATTKYCSLSSAETPISLEQADTALRQIQGYAFSAESRAGHTVNALYLSGSDAPVMISGGQHANETSGVVGALRAAQTLANSPGSHFTICPIENPDGYALHQRLITDNPHHMHHAARYTALGDDLEYRHGSKLFEKEIRLKAQTLSKAQLHINLHGYPSHEWTRPLSGYVPQGFDMWTLPKGFFLILRHREDWSTHASLFIDKVTRKLSDIPGLLTFNQTQIDLYQIHAGETGFRMINGFPCLISYNQPSEVPLQLITEYPDETINGEHFIKGHTVQTLTILAAYDAYQELMKPLN